MTCASSVTTTVIYGFTGATPGLPARPPRPVIRLETNTARRRRARAREPARAALGGAEKTLRAVRPEGPDSVVPRVRGPRGGPRSSSSRKELQREGVPYDEIAVLYRTNARSRSTRKRSPPRGIPYASAPAPSSSGRPPAGCCRASPLLLTRGCEEVRRLAKAQGLLEEPAEGLGESELARQQDSPGSSGLAEELDDGDTAAEFVTSSKTGSPTAGERRASISSPTTAPRGSSSTPSSCRASNGRSFRSGRQDGRGCRRGAAAALRRADAREAPPVPDPCRAAEPVSRGARHRIRARSAARRPTRRSFLRLPCAQGVAPDARPPRRCPGLRRVPRRHARRDSTRHPATPAELAGVSGVGPAKLERYGARFSPRWPKPDNPALLSANARSLDCQTCGEPWWAPPANGCPRCGYDARAIPDPVIWTCGQVLGTPVWITGQMRNPARFACFLARGISTFVDVAGEPATSGGPTTRRSTPRGRLRAHPARGHERRPAERGVRRRA